MADKRLKYLNKGKRAGDQSGRQRPKSVRIKITSNGRLSFEDLTAALHKGLGKLEGYGAAGVEHCALYVSPRSAEGSPVVLRDQQGREVQEIDIYIPVAPRFAKATAA